MPDVGATYFLPRIFNKNTHIGLYVGLTGERIKGKDLVKCGLATHFVSSNKIDSLKNALIEISDDNVDYQKLHQICNNYADLVYDAKEFYFPNMGEINKIFLHDNLIDCIKRIKTLSIEGNEENQKWSNNIIKNLSSCSPISLLLHFEQIKKGIEGIFLTIVLL